MFVGLLKKIALALLAAVAAATPARADWLRAESPHFVVYGEGGEAQLRSRVAELEDYDGLLRLLTGTTALERQSKLNVYLVRGYAELRQIRPGLGSNVAGFYTGTNEAIIAVSDVARAGSRQSGNEILFHEYAHHFLLQYFPGVYPLWYTEGFAEYLMTARFEGQTIELGRSHPGRTYFLSPGMRWLELEEVLWGFRREPTPIAQGQFYAQSWLLVHYLLRDRERSRQLNRYLVAVSGGRDPRAAFTEAFGVTPAQMQSQLQDYRDHLTFSRLQRVSAATPPQIAIARLPVSVDRLILADVALRIADSGDATSALERVRAAALGGDDAFSRRVLGRAEALYGDGAAAERLLAPLLADAPNDAELLYLTGVRRARAAAAAGGANARTEMLAAAAYFERALAADPGFYPAAYREAHALATVEGPASAAALDLALRAHRLAPQAPTIRLTAAVMLIARERWSEAEALLTPLASAAHAGSSATTAQALLAKVRARDRTGLPSPFAPTAGKSD